MHFSECIPIVKQQVSVYMHTCIHTHTHTHTEFGDGREHEQANTCMKNWRLLECFNHEVIRA